jgi:metallo-beta-lactamase family protein
MRITVHGAGDGEVTGLAYLVQKRSANVLVDCGLFQGAKKTEHRNRIPQKGVFRTLDSAVLTHTHLDHTGRLPLLTKLDYNGPMHATPATIELADPVLRDSAHLLGQDTERENRRRAGEELPPLEVLYAERDVEALRALYRLSAVSPSRQCWNSGRHAPGPKGAGQFETSVDLTCAPDTSTRIYLGVSDRRTQREDS